ncbi:FAD-dependent monooxygenase [Rhodobacteraceae bacterium N5(2021)]|uniref:FAD-dependent monooxygenase n=1 Tax=Gymnodinialimonas phycosphaerae TaxID=2841589 RepID=A0A975YGM5_9RHOB|nr:FAD-dependent monooxygenase [Gymnodinialimonas phycosphaerae]MBY4891827.1 FAD-dependent monooxygenase [Gymnodinialimonas phycosphaerae]
MDFTHEVIVIGGGPVGMGLAIDLGQRGIKTAVVERHPEPQMVPKGQNLTQRSLENIDSWGCEPKMRAARVMPPGLANGGLVTYRTILSDYAYDWLARENVQPYYGQRVDRMPQYQTEKVLRARAAELDTIDLRYGLSFKGLDQDDDGVMITADDGSVLRARYAVACDGSNSATRDAAGITQTITAHDRKMVLIVFKSPDLSDLLAKYHPPRSFYNALDPELNGYWKFLGRVDGVTEWFFHAPVPTDTTRKNTDFEAILTEAVGASFEIDISYVGFWDLRFALADRYRKDRVLVAGDASHSHPPYGGYGINTGFEDARNLGWKLAAALDGWAGDALLDSYDAERRPVFASLGRDFIGNFIEEDRDFLQTYSPEKDPAEFATKWSARNEGDEEVLAYEPNYQGSPIVDGDGTPSARGDHRFDARAGHHIAPRALSDGRTTYQTLGAGFTLFAFGVDSVDFAEAAQALSIPLTIVADTFEEERRDYVQPLILVRPDGFVSWCGQAGDADQILRMAIGAQS